MHKPCEGHWSVTKRFLRYLKGNQDFGLNYTKVEDFKLIGYTNSYFEGEKEIGVSTSGYTMSLGSTTISRRLQKQLVQAYSIIEEEYVAAAKETKDIVWLINIREYLQDNQ